MTDTPTTEQIAKDYSAMGDSVALINDVIAGNAMSGDDAADRQDCVDRNTQHLELMVAKDYWTSESMTATNAAIAAGKGYTAS
jgi:Flp pilus assembly CpaE family ATPase